MKVICFTDIHANLPALQAVLKAIRHEGYDALFHTGDAIGIGPFPAECLELLLETARISFIMGNIDAFFVYGLPDPQTKGMDHDQIEHHQWTHSQLNNGFRQVMSQWPCFIEQEFEEVRCTFVHYGLDDPGRDFVPVVKHPVPTDLDKVFQQFSTDVVFYGHHHPFSDLQGTARYINPGSLGCYTQPFARYTVIEFKPGQYKVEHHSIPYEDEPLLKAFQEREVPDAHFIFQAFYGGRFRT